MKPVADRSVRTRRGQPLLVLGLLLAGWIGLRAAAWEGIGLPPARLPVETAAVQRAPDRARSPLVLPDSPRPAASSIVTIRPLPPGQSPVDFSPPQVEPERPLLFASGPSETVHVAAAHQLAWMAGVAQLPVPQFIVDRLGQGQRRESLVPSPVRQYAMEMAAISRWSGDGWLLLREGGAGASAAGLPSPSYGASQVGAVIRYRLSATDPRRPALYLRATSAVRRPRGEEAALGLSARPLAPVPVALQVELRATQQVLGTRFRPALSVLSELPRQTLPAGLSAELYGQAGYVGGSDATAFADAQVRIERRIAQLGRSELRAGLGAWGGAQKGANRLDIGPTATLDFALGTGRGRLSADWRLRAAGNAAPQTGPALTLSAGF